MIFSRIIKTLSISAVVLSVGSVIFFYRQEISSLFFNKELRPITESHEYKKAVELQNSKDYSGAELIYNEIEATQNLSMDNYSLLQLKKLQIALSKKEYFKAADILERVFKNPTIKKEVKARALENTFMFYLSQGKPFQIYKEVFSTEFFKTFEKGSPEQSFYSAMEFAYKLHPTSIITANLIFKEIAEIKGLEDGEKKEGKVESVSELLNVFARVSEQELVDFKNTGGQEVILINIHTDRAKVAVNAGRVKELAGVLKLNTKIEEDLQKAYEYSASTDAEFLRFYTAFNYIDRMSAIKISLPASISSSFTEKEVFSKEKVTRGWFEVGTNNKVWTNSERLRFSDYNLQLKELIDLYSQNP